MPGNNSREYTVGWICALSVELVAAEAMLDERFEDRSCGQYTLGRIGHHNVVIACLPAGLMGTTAAATVATRMACNLPSISFGLMVGIGGGVPSQDSDVRLGDVVVSQPRNGYGGVVQYDFGKARPGDFEMTGFLNAPPTVLLDALSTLQVKHLSGKSHISDYVLSATRQLQFALETTREDMLFEPDYDHMGGSSCESCSKGRLVQRRQRDQGVAIHYGTIASGNQVMRDGRTRDRLSSRFGGVLCFEMEAAGLMNSFPCLVIRGICDYADSHKHKSWQPYAAITAAAYAKELLTAIPGSEVVTTGAVNDATKLEMIEADIGSHIDALDLNWFLSILPVIDPKEVRYDASSNDPIEFSRNAPSLEFEKPEYCWVLKNIDFLNWDSGISSPSLWLSGPPECDMSRVASSIVQRERCKPSAEQRRIASFFCPTAVAKVSPVAMFIRALAYHILSLPTNHTLVAQTFLRSILNDIQNKVSKNQLLQLFAGPSENYIERLLGVPEGSLWEALWAIIPTVESLGLSFLVAGIDCVRDRRDQFIQDIRIFVNDLQRRSRIRIILMSGLEDDTARMFTGLSHIRFDKERKECLSKLSFLNTRFEKIVKESEGTFEWLWNHAQYARWSRRDVSSVLLIEGKPGSGKSTLTKYFNEHILRRLAAARTAIVARFFYSFRDGRLQRSHSNMLRSLLYDIVSQDEAFFYHVQQEYRDGRSVIGDWKYQSLKRMLEALLHYQLPRPLYLIIDAVDESEEADRRDIIKLLFQLGATKANGTIKIFVASRPMEQLNVRRKNINSIIQLQAETLPDISRFARSMLDGLNVSLLLNKATEYIINNANGVFLWVRLVGCELEASLEDSESEDVIFQRLKQLPTELEDFYQLMLDRLDNKPQTADSITMFQIILWAARPVTTDELLQAVAISNMMNTDDVTDQSLDLRVPSRDRITRCGGNFLEFKQSNGKETVQIMHQTAREFLLRPDGYVTKTRFFMRDRESIICISRMCIQYFKLCARCTSLLEQLPATWLWGWKDYNDYARYLDKRPFVNYALTFLEQNRDSSSAGVGMSKLFDGLNQGAGAHFVYLLERWTSSNLDIGVEDETQLESARKFRANLFYAATADGYHVAVEIMLAVGTDVNLQWAGERTALSLAAEEGQEAVASILLARPEVKTDASDCHDFTPLMYAAGNGHHGMVALLLRHPSATNARDNTGETALHRAIKRGHRAVAKLLLAQGGFLANIPDRERWTPLFWAVRKGDFDMVRAFISHNDVKVDGQDYDRQTPLSLAVQHGHHRVARLLLTCKNVGAVLRDKWGRTALWYAVREANFDIVKALLSRDDVDHQTRYSKDALLELAVHLGHTEIAQLLRMKL